LRSAPPYLRLSAAPSGGFTGPRGITFSLEHLPDPVLNYNGETLLFAAHFRQPARQAEPVLTDGLHCAAHVRHVGKPGAHIPMGFKRSSTCSGPALRLLVPVPRRGYLRHLQRWSRFCVVVTQVGRAVEEYLIHDASDFITIIMMMMMIIIIIIIMNIITNIDLFIWWCNIIFMC
jgi:hypothetical protein